MLFINRTVILIVAGNALGFFTGSGNVIPFSIDLTDFWRSFRVESNTTIKFYLSYHFLFVNEVHNGIKTNSRFDIQTSIWYEIIFRTRNRMNFKLCKIIRREYVFIVVVHRFLRREKLFNFDKGWALKSDRRRVLFRNFTSCWVRSWKKQSAAVEEDFWRMIFQSSKLLLLHDFNWFIPALYGQVFLVLVKTTTVSMYGRYFFFRDLVQMLTLFCFSVICSE